MAGETDEQEKRSRERPSRAERGCLLRSAIKVGVLHSLSGTMAISETTLKDTVLMLVEEQNKKGGLLGKKLEAVVVDPASDWPLFAEKARELLEKDKVAAGVRLLDLGLAQVGAAGVRGAERPPVLPGAVRG
jgi:ABC-type branched-subunit amino acid transport system substrate-binding protein